MSHDRPADPSQLRWSVKSSFWQYVQNAGGTVEALAPWTLADGYVMAPVRVERAGDALRIEADGGIRFTAHGGRLAVTLRDLSLVLAGDGATLSIQDPEAPPARLEIAKGAVRRDDDLWAIESALSFFGCRLFSDVYQPGEALDPIHLQGGHP